MSLAALRSPLRRHLVWLLWLALSLPLAQGVAGLHQLSHAAAGDVDGAQRKPSPAPTPDSTPCDLCLAAAALSGAAPLALPVMALPPAPAATPAPAAKAPLWLSGVERRYLSRAPPDALL